MYCSVGTFVSLLLILLTTESSMRADDAPKGEVTEYSFEASKIFSRNRAEVLRLRAEAV